MNQFTLLKKYSLLAAIGLSASLTACGERNDNSSDILVTDIAHTSVKKQTIGNCWLYATTTWAESLHLSATENEINISESYWTWLYFYEQLINGQEIEEINTGGTWMISANLIRKYGYLLEGEFIEDEADKPASEAQSKALAEINKQLEEGGSLADPETRTQDELVRILDEAFGSDMMQALKDARSANALVVGTDDYGDSISLLDAVAGDPSTRWSYSGYKQAYGEGADVSLFGERQRKKLLKRVMRALNDKNPVVVSMMIDFNAFDKEAAEFNMATLDEAGEPGRQGGHMIVLEDYTVKNVPGIGDIGEGDLSEEMKEKALQGDLNTLIVKNSWGDTTNEGYHRFNIDYLNGTLPWKQGEDVSYYTTLSAFILPPGY